MTYYPEINNYLNLLKKKRELSDNGENTENIQKEIESYKINVIKVIEDVLTDMGLKKRKILSDFNVKMKFDAGLMIEFRTVPSISFLNEFEKRINGFVPANYCGDAKKCFYMFKY